MKTKEELNALREEAENLGKKLAELTEEELSQVAGGIQPGGTNEIRPGDAAFRRTQRELVEFERTQPQSFSSIGTTQAEDDGEHAINREVIP